MTGYWPWRKRLYWDLIKLLFSGTESSTVVSNSLWHHGLYSPWNSTGQNIEAIPFSRGSSQPRDWTEVSSIAGRFFTSWATREAPKYLSVQPIPSPVHLWNSRFKLGSPALQADSIPTELFQILKDDAVKVLHSICYQFGKVSSGQRNGKGQFSKHKERQCQKNVQTTAWLPSSHTLAK